ncbi:MAG: 1-deoxy-D-xylulose-5-phosphate reductoisomerase [Chloroflexota bacterium]
MPRNLVVLGSTGSIGRQTLQIAGEKDTEIVVYGLAAHTSAATLAAQARACNALHVVLVDGTTAGQDFGRARVERGTQAMIEMCTRPEVDLVVVGTAGAAGLHPTLAALRAGKLVALANKESLVMAGPIIQQELQKGSGRLVPIDSEHSALWQCLQGEALDSVERLTLTASGGALRDLSQGELRDVTPERALRHPTWSMGPKITVDSANLMNKGLETIEARWLFNVPHEQIDIVMHPQSIVHSLVTFRDGSVKAQLGLPDMRLPIQYALSHPMRWHADIPRLDLPKAGTLTFDRVDFERYPALQLALEAGRLGGIYPAALCAADEIAVEAFLERRLRFTDIPPLVQQVLDSQTHCGSPTLDDILEVDGRARALARRLASQ